jgi:hypothetical protein
MPLTRYFVWVGGVLLALLFVADAWLPELPLARTIDALPPAIHIHSDQKWPERIVFDTSATVPGQASAANAQTDGSAPATIALASSKLREARAELRTTDAGLPVNPKRPEARSKHQRNVAKKHSPKPVLLAARRAPFGWFGPTFW